MPQYPRSWRRHCALQILQFRIKYFDSSLKDALCHGASFMLNCWYTMYKCIQSVNYPLSPKRSRPSAVFAKVSDS